MIFYENQIEIKILRNFVPVNNLGEVQEGDVFRTIGDNGQPIITTNIWLNGKYYASIHSWRATEDAHIDEMGRYQVSAVPEEAYLGLAKYGNTFLMAPTWKSYISAAAIVALDVVVIGFIAPVLISSINTSLVLGGFALLGTCLTLTFAFVASFFQKEKK